MSKSLYACILLLTITLRSADSVKAQCARATMVNNYKNIYLTSNVSYTDLAWTGSTATCTPGTISALAQTRTLARINYFRQLAGLPGNIIFDNTLNLKCQQAALMMEANGTITHTPPTTWMCYTSDGALAASKSNIASGSNSSGSVNDYMDDYGTGNTAAGHRRWILYGAAGVFGHGSTTSKDALWVVNTTVTPPAVSYTAYPSPGFFPAPLVPSSGRWSFSKAGADFSGATIEMRDAAGALVPITPEAVVNGFGDNTIVWVASTVKTTSPTDVKYTVKVKNVLVNSVSNTYTYDVKICQPVHPPPCPVGMSWSESLCDCKTSTGTGPELMAGTQVSVSSPFTEELSITLTSGHDEDLYIRVSNAYGQSVVSQKVRSAGNGGSKNVSFSAAAAWMPGMYVVEVVNSDGEKSVVKMVKQ